MKSSIIDILNKKNWAFASFFILCPFCAPFSF
jgi:hypothetical protein